MWILVLNKNRVFAVNRRMKSRKYIASLVFNKMDVELNIVQDMDVN